MGHLYHTLPPQGSSQKRGKKYVSARLVDDKEIVLSRHSKAIAPRLHSSCGSRHKTSAGPNQTKFQPGKLGGHEVLPSLRNYWPLKAAEREGQFPLKRSP